MSKTAPTGVGALMHGATSNLVVVEKTVRVGASRRGRKDRFRVQRGVKIGGGNTLFWRACCALAIVPSSLDAHLVWTIQ